MVKVLSSLFLQLMLYVDSDERLVSDEHDNLCKYITATSFLDRLGTRGIFRPRCERPTEWSIGPTKVYTMKPNP